jgi:signal transduction histidine kinase
MTPVRAEAVRTLYLQMRNSAASAVVVTLYMAGTAAVTTPWRVIGAWASVQIAMQFGRELLIRAWRRRARADAELAPWARYYVIYMALAGAVWGVTIFLFAHPAQPISVALTMCCLYSIAAGSVPANAYNPAGLYAIVGCMFVPIVVRLIATGEFGYILLGAASGLYGVAMAGMCRVQARTLDEGFRIRFENVALLEALTVQTAEAEAARRHAELASLAKSQFLAAASHDLRQPLYALSLFSASLEELRLDADGRTVVGRIQDSIGAMEQLFNGLLDLSRLDAGVVQPDMASVSVDALFDRLSQYFHPIAGERDLDLRFRSDGEWVTSDPTLLEQVLGNLVGNALRYTQTGGVLVAARRRSGIVDLEVWDTGVGMAAADLTRIFEEFVQLGNAERDRRKGLGLGLSIARRSAALLGATIDVASRPGRGSRFGLAQPACLPPDAHTAPGILDAAMVPLTWRHDLPLLIVDDDRDVRAAMADLLRRWNVRFDAAADAQAALALVKGGARYGLILADYRLGAGLNGLDLLLALTALHAAQPPATALVTADFDVELIGAARAVGIPLIQKPLRPARLRALLGVAIAESAET